MISFGDVIFEIIWIFGIPQISEWRVTEIEYLLNGYYLPNKYFGLCEIPYHLIGIIIFTERSGAECALKRLEGITKNECTNDDTELFSSIDGRKK